MATQCPQANVPTLKTCFEHISQIVEDERKNFKAKILKLEEEKSVLYGLLQTRNGLEKENADLKSENNVLKEEVSFFRLTSKESHEQYSALESKYQQYKKGMTKKQADWERFVHTVDKKCICSFNKDRLKKKKSESLISTPSVKIKNVSNVFFMSPVKSRLSDHGAALLAPMTEDYNTNVQLFKSSTPVVVGETERSPSIHYEINSSDDESDGEEVGSPSLFTDHDSKYETPATSNKLKKYLKTISIDLCKPSPVDRLTLGELKHERTETSAVLFSDKSIVDDHGHKVGDVSSESNIDFHKSSVHMPKKEAKSIKLVKMEDEKAGKVEKEEKENAEHKTHGCFEEPVRPVSKKRKYTSQEREADESTHRNNISNTKNSSGNQTWLRGNNVINPKDNTSNTILMNKQVEKSTKNVFSSVENNKSTKVNPKDNTTNIILMNKQVEKSTKNVFSGVENNKSTKVNYKHSTVVRKKHEREKLDGFACDECRRYYESDKLSKEQLAEVLKNCSRHKHVSAPPPSTPEQFWALDFPQTQDCIDKGYMLDENQTLPDHIKPKYKRGKKKKSVNFK